MRYFGLALGALIMLGAGCRGGGHPLTARPEDPTAIFGSTDASSTEYRPDPADSTSPTGIACNHEYYPLRLGYHIQYQTTYPPSRGTTGSGLNAIAVRSLASDRVQLQNVVDSGDGIRSYFDFGYICRGGSLMATGYVEAGSFLPGELGRRRSKVQTDSSSGEFLPVHISPGNTWASEFNVKISPAEGSAPDKFGSDAPIRVPVKIVRIAIGVERVTVPAGTFEAMKIKTSTSFNGVPAMHGTEWWVKEVGMVKATYDAGSGTEDVVTVARGVTVPGFIDIPSADATSSSSRP